MKKYTYKRVTRCDIHFYNIYRDDELIEMVYDKSEAQRIVRRYNRTSKI